MIGQNIKTVNKLIDEMTLFDDDLMSRVFDKNIKATELVLRIILGRNIQVIRAEGQDEMKSPEVGGRSITLDVHALDENGEEMDIEVQGNTEGAHIRRARFHSSMMDSRMLKSGQKFKELKDSYVIFLYKYDKFKRGLPLYHVGRYVAETGEAFTDGSHIIYVNGSYRGKDELGRLIKDFHQADPECMSYDILAQSVNHFKETEKGREIMCESVQKYAEEYAKEYAKEYAAQKQVISVKNLMDNAKFTLEQALNALGIQGEERTFISKQLQK